MKGLMAAALLACVSIAPAGASDTSRDLAIANLLRQRVHDWEKAVQSGDADTVAQIEADDWRSVGYRGDVSGKEDDLNDLKAGKRNHLRLELGPIDVKVLSDSVAVIQGTATDLDAAAKGNGGTYAYMDVFVKGAEGWSVTRSLTAKVK